MTGLKAKRGLVNGFLALVVVGMGSLLLGGCANQKDQQISQLQSENAQLKEEKAQLEQARVAAEAKASDTSMKQNTVSYPPDSPRGGPKGARGGNDVVITVAGDVLFASGQVTLKSEAKKELDKIARDLNGKYSGHQVRVEGYTDSDPIKKSKFGSNEALSQARAEAVEKYLISKGVSTDRISAVGMGAAKAKATKPASRRVEIVVVAQQ